MDKKELNFVLTISSKILSVNNLYKAGVKYIKGRPTPYIYKNPKALEIEREVIEQLRAVDFTDYMNWLSNTKQFDLTISFILKSNVTRRDVSNIQKDLTDDIVRFINNELGIKSFDDRLFNSVHFYKSIIPKSEHEYACVSIVESKSNLRFDKIEKPEKIFLGTEDYSWKKEIKKEIKDKKLKSFEKLEDESKCNTHLFIITPEIRQTLIIDTSKIINKVWECLTSESGFIFIGVLNSDEWTTHEKNQLEKFINLVKNISNNSRIKIGLINEPKNIFNL